MPHMWVDVDTALASCPVNLLPLVDATDPSVIEDAVVWNQAGLALFWNFTTTAGVTTVTAVTPTTGDDHDWTDFTTSGMYGIEIPASAGDVNNDTEGFGHFTGVATGILPWAGPVIGFRAPTINVALVTGDTLLTSVDVGLLREDPILTVSGQDEFIMTTAITSDDNWLGNIVTIEDVSTGEVVSRWITSVVASSKTVFINADCPFTTLAGDVLRVYRETHASYAINFYDPPTRAESASDTSTILAKLLAYVRLMTRKDAAPTTDDASELAEINSNAGAGSGAFTPVDDTLEAQADIDVAIKAKTDQLIFTVAGELDANAKSANDAPILGVGSNVDKWRGA